MNNDSGADPFENGYNPKTIEKIYRERLTQLLKVLKPFADLGVGSGPDHETETYRIERGAIRNARAAVESTPPQEQAPWREALIAAKEFADDEFNNATDLNRKNRIVGLCDKIDAALNSGGGG